MNCSMNVDSANPEELETCYVKSNSFDALIKDLLLVKQYRVEVWRRREKSNEWTMVNQGSPGNLTQFEEILYSVDDSEQATTISDPGLIAIQIATDDNLNVSIRVDRALPYKIYLVFFVQKLNAAFVDKSARSFLVCTISFKDNFTDLEVCQYFTMCTKHMYPPD